MKQPADYYTEFFTTCRGASAWCVAKALNKLTPGTDWRGVTKGHMASEYARDNSSPRSVYYPRLKDLDLTKLRALIEASIERAKEMKGEARP